MRIKSIYYNEEKVLPENPEFLIQSINLNNEYLIIRKKLLLIQIRK